MANNDERSGLTARRASKVIQNTTPDAYANMTTTEFAKEELARDRQQNQMSAAPGQRAKVEKNPAD